jgi:hypothetical protein
MDESWNLKKLDEPLEIESKKKGLMMDELWETESKQIGQWMNVGKSYSKHKENLLFS